MFNVVLFMKVYWYSHHLKTWCTTHINDPSLMMLGKKTIASLYRYIVVIYWLKLISSFFPVMIKLNSDLHCTVWYCLFSSQSTHSQRYNIAGLALFYRYIHSKFVYVIHYLVTIIQVFISKKGFSVSTELYQLLSERVFNWLKLICKEPIIWGSVSRVDVTLRLYFQTFQVRCQSFSKLYIFIIIIRHYHKDTNITGFIN